MLTSETVRLDLPHILTSLPGPRAKAVIERDRKVLSPSYTRCLSAGGEPRRRAPSSRTWMAIVFSISTPESRWPPPAIAIRKWWQRSKNSPSG